MTIDQSTAIKIPVYCAGNVGGFYNEYSDHSDYFKIVDMDDVAFQDRDIHVQLNTKSKLYSRADNDAFGATPNTRINEVDLGFPGVLPVLNKPLSLTRPTVSS